MYHGIINIYKEPGYTSHDVVAKLRGILKQKKIGHTGTLDPAAEGVLPVCLGKGTRLCDMLTEKTKTYRAVLLLGVETDTQDTTGEVLLRRPTEGVTEEQIRRIAEEFVGPYEQIPPMYSALKVGGKKLCDLARAGQVVERKARPVVIHSLTIEEIRMPRVTMTVCCSKGTYIRTLCHDIGEKLGCGGTMEHLIRTQSGAFLIQDSLKLDQVEEFVREGKLEQKIVPVESVFADCGELRSGTPLLDKLLANGNPFTVEQARGAVCGAASAGNEPGSRGLFAGVPAERESEPCGLSGSTLPGSVPLGSVLPGSALSGSTPSGGISGQDGARYRVYDSAGRFIGIYEFSEEETKWQPRKIFLGGEQ